ncbi:MAG: hypothetical protein JRG71_15080 [Deltaproteobacteria bacterium]|nr:hypothetical protein [Deltaproteobacteria bacterium]
MDKKHLKSHKMDAISSVRFLIICFIVITLFVSLTGVVFYQYQKRATISAARTNLFMVADLKARQIGHWRQERISLARLLTSNSSINDQIVTYLNEPTVEIKEKISNALWPTLNESEGHTILLVDNEGNVQLNIGDMCTVGEHIDQQQLTLALQQHQIEFGKIYHSHTPPTKTVVTHNNHLHMNLIAPIYLNNNQNNPPLGALIIVINPNHFLLPLMTSWPVPSESPCTRHAKTGSSYHTPATRRDSHSRKVSQGGQRGLFGRLRLSARCYFCGGQESGRLIMDASSEGGTKRNDPAS